MTILRLAVDADACAAALREQSERTIRAHAHRLLADRGDALRVMPVEQCATELLALAEMVANEEFGADALAATSLPYLTAVENASSLFEELVAAVQDRAWFTTDPEGWLLAHDHPVGMRMREAHDESTLAAVDEARDYLLGARS